MSDRTVHLETSDSASKQLQKLVTESRGVVFTQTHGHLSQTSTSTSLLQRVTTLSHSLVTQGFPREAEALNDAHAHCTTSPDFGGLGLNDEIQLSEQDEADVTFYVSAYLEALNSQDRYDHPLRPLSSRPDGRRGMTLTEKIFAAHDTERKGSVKPGDVIRVDVDWVIASELSWAGMAQTYNDLGGDPGIFRNDRLWIAGDHVVHPTLSENPKIKSLVSASENARKVFKMTENQGMNYTIMHTEFCRERAQPGMLVIGSDSHTCSAGSVSCLAIGLGVADVTMPTVTGQTWFKVPETVEIRFINEPKPGLGGKDVILYVLQQLKRNTVASERVVEYTGPGIKHLSCDARFAIANMTTEFGGITGIFVPDNITKEFIDRRRNPKYKKLAAYYQPDEDAQYVETHIIDLAKVEPFVAKYPSPDDVVVASELKGTKLDGVFIGACTTAREDLILGAMVLKAGLKKGKTPIRHGKRNVTPGSRPILHDLRKRGILDIYEKCGFEVGIPGCSYCLGMSRDKAGSGEVWLSSQNRNFENRMGPGAIGNLASAVTVAASSFDMEITDPTDLLNEVDLSELAEHLGTLAETSQAIAYVHPGEEAVPQKSDLSLSRMSSLESTSASSSISNTSREFISGKVKRLGDFIDTDALAPAEALVGKMTDEETGRFCLKYTHPQFRDEVKAGHNIVVAGKGFGVGSSRENAVSALRGAGVQAVIAQSFAFIYSRNQPNLGLLGFVINDPKFYELATEGKDIEIDVLNCLVTIDGQNFTFALSQLERQLIEYGGISNAFHKWGKDVFEVMTSPQSAKIKASKAGVLADDADRKAREW